MATDEEILRAWNGLPKSLKETEAILRLYRLAEETGRKEGLAAMERELVSDATIEKALHIFGWDRRGKSSVITVRAVMREAARIAAEKASK